MLGNLSRRMNGGLDGTALGIDLSVRGHEVRKLMWAGFGHKILRAGYDPEDVLQEVFRGLIARNKGTCPWDARKSSFGHYVHLVIGCVLRFGHGAEALAWGVMFVLMPLSGIFYPIDALPPFIRPIALALPTTYAFKALRGVVDGQPLDWGLVGIGALGAVVLSLLAGWFLVAMLRTFRRRGYVTRYS